MKILPVSKRYVKASHIFWHDQSYYRFWRSEVTNAFLSLQPRHGEPSLWKDHSIKSLKFSLIKLCGTIGPFGGKKPCSFFMKVLLVCTGCLKNVDLFWKCYNSFIYGRNFFKFSMVVASLYCFVSMIFYYQVALLSGNDVIMLWSHTLHHFLFSALWKLHHESTNWPQVK